MTYVGSRPANKPITSADIEDGVVSTVDIGDDQITTDKLANSINSAITANTAKTTNATHSGEVTGSGALTIADNIVDEANLKVSNAPTNGYALTAQSGNTGGLTWAESAGFSVSSITGATALAVEPASTDEMVISDAGTLKRLDMTHIYGLPACNVGGTTSLYPASGTTTLVTWVVEGYDYGGCFNHTTGSVTLNGLTAPAHSFTPNVPGIYQFTYNMYWAGEGIDGDSYLSINHYLNGSHYIDMSIGFMEHGHFDDNNLDHRGVICLPMNGTGDYYQTKIFNNTGEAPELNFGYSSLTINRIAGLPVASRPNYG